ncbi:MAG: response regulator [Rhodospirillaceae bacterium]
MHILLVDDDPFVRDVAVTALSAVRGVKVEAYGGGAEALAALDDFSPDLVVLDLMMPAMDGRGVWAAIRDRGGPRPRLIFLTGRDDPATREELTALGASGLIVKPFDPRTLAAEVLGFADAGILRTARLEAVARDFAGSLPATLSVIDAAWRAMKPTEEGGWQAAAAETLLAEAHRIAGVAPMFQFHRLGEAADKVEELLRAALSSGGWRENTERAEVEGAVGALMEEGAAVNA